VFYFKIRVMRKHGATRSNTDEFRVALRTQDIGDLVAAHLNGRAVKGVSVKRISQATYMRETGGIE
jgi:hypothetical protein